MSDTAVSITTIYEKLEEEFHFMLEYDPCDIDIAMPFQARSCMIRRIRNSSIL